MDIEQEVEYMDKGAEAAKAILNGLNGTGLSEFANGFLDEIIMRGHHTLQQCFMSGIVVNFILRQADNKYYDGRNEMTVKVCQKLKETLVENDADRRFPFI